MRSARLFLPGNRRELLAGLLVVLFVLAWLAVGAWRGFPVQDDTYMVRLVRMGGPALVAQQHDDRPLYGRILTALTGLWGERKPFYIVLALLVWSLLAAEAAAFWIWLFPEWRSRWPVIVLAVAAPVLVHVQFTTVTTVLPCVLPVVLVLGAFLLLARLPDAGAGAGWRAAAAGLTFAGGLLSEYAALAGVASAVVLWVLRRRRGAATLLLGVALGYVVFSATADLHLRDPTDPHVQLHRATTEPAARSLRVAAATWHSVAGAWGRAVSEFTLDWDSKSTLFALALGLGIALAVGRTRDAPEPRPSVTRRVAALLAGVAVGVAPPALIKGWPPSLVYETRFLLPILVFASCATAAILFAAVRPRFVGGAAACLAFVAANRLVVESVQEGRIQNQLDALGRRLLPLVEEGPHVVTLVSPDRTGSSGEEMLGKVTYRWSASAAQRLWILRPPYALRRFGPRSSCRDPEKLGLPVQDIRWPRADDRVRVILWDASLTGEPDPEPYFRGCVDR